MTTLRIEIASEPGKPVSADLTLRTATSTLKLLKSIEREVTKDKVPKPPKVTWEVDIMTGADVALINLFGSVPGPDQHIVFEQTAEFQKRLQRKP